MQAYMQITAPDDYTVARWHGGEYIELGYIDGEDFRANDVINVWDYAKGEPRIPRTLEAFENRVTEWFAEQDTEQS